MTVKALVEIKRMLAREGFELIEAPQYHGHYTLHIRHPDGRIQKLTMGSSPSNPHDALKHTMQRVRRFARSNRASHDAIDELASRLY